MNNNIKIEEFSGEVPAINPQHKGKWQKIFQEFLDSEKQQIKIELSEYGIAFAAKNAFRYHAARANSKVKISQRKNFVFLTKTKFVFVNNKDFLILNKNEEEKKVE